jgi:hypothetical protein
MPTNIWNRTIDLKPAVQVFKAAAGIPATAEKAVEIIEQSGWLADTPYPDTLRDHLNRLKQAASTAEYLAAFDYIYDVADADHVWISTN